jgi:hypothetical protein
MTIACVSIYEYPLTQFIFNFDANPSVFFLGQKKEELVRVVRSLYLRPRLPQNKETRYNVIVYVARNIWIKLKCREGKEMKMSVGDIKSRGSHTLIWIYSYMYIIKCGLRSHVGYACVHCTPSLSLCSFRVCFLLRRKSSRRAHCPTDCLFWHQSPLQQRARNTNGRLLISELINSVSHDSILCA